MTLWVISYRIAMGRAMSASTLESYPDRCVTLSDALGQELTKGV